MWIELTDEKNRKIMVNFENVLFYRKSESVVGSYLTTPVMQNGKPFSIKVKETTSEIGVKLSSKG